MDRKPLTPTLSPQERGEGAHRDRCAISLQIEPFQTQSEDDMKILYFDDYKLGVLKGDTVVDVSSIVQSVPHTGPHDLINGVIARFAEYRPRLEEAAAR